MGGGPSATLLSPQTRSGIATRNKALGLTVGTNHGEEHHCGLSRQNSKWEQEEVMAEGRKANSFQGTTTLMG